jgi:hypothetical protein
VIAKLVPALVAVGPIKHSRVTGGRRAMVYDDGGPSSADFARSREPRRVAGRSR